LLGGRAIRQIVYDPLLPPPLVDVAERRAFIETMKAMESEGRRIWKRFSPSATRRSRPRCTSRNADQGASGGANEERERRPIARRDSRAHASASSASRGAGGARALHGTLSSIFATSDAQEHAGADENHSRIHCDLQIGVVPEVVATVHRPLRQAGLAIDGYIGTHASQSTMPSHVSC
jgi:hypothetical protein